MQKTLLYILILGVLGAGVWFFLFREESIFSGKDAGFTVRDTAVIGKIFLATNSNQSVKLERTAKGWMVDGKYKAREASIDQLLHTLNSQVAQTPVSEQMHNNIVRSLMSGNIKVEIYDVNGHKMRVFYVGGQVGNGSGTYMLMEGGNRPYVVQIPGFSGYLTPRYTPDLANWRDRTVFNIAQENVSKIAVQYGLEPLNSFVITQNGKQLGVQLDPGLMSGKPLNEKRVHTYISFYDRLYAERVINGVEGVREELSTVPLLCSIDVTGNNGYHQHADIYFTPISRRSKNRENPKTDTASYYDADRMYAVINNKQDTMIIQSFQFDKVFRKGYEFYEQDAQQQDVTTGPKQ